MASAYGVLQMVQVPKSHVRVRVVSCAVGSACAYVRVCSGCVCWVCCPFVCWVCGAVLCCLWVCGAVLCCLCVCCAVLCCLWVCGGCARVG